MSDATPPGALTAEFTVPADHPCLPGHFPAEPIVPAVLLLDLTCAARRRALPQCGVLRELRQAKFTRPVRPGETVTVSFSAAGAAYRFSCATPAGVAAQGVLVFGAAA